jgi:hypothetical protein
MLTTRRAHRQPPGAPGGPRTAEGKQRSCRSARKHGLYTDERFLEGATLIGAVFAAAFKKIKNRGNELKDLLQRQGITEIAASKRTHFCAERAAIGVERSGISRTVGGRLAVPRLKWSGAIRGRAALRTATESSSGVALTFRSAVQETRDRPAHLKAAATQIRGTKRECL